jgi:hypothetical protein
MQVKTAMKRKVGKEPEGGSNKRKEVENESPLASMFQKQQTANDVVSNTSHSGRLSLLAALMMIDMTR